MLRRKISITGLVSNSDKRIHLKRFTFSVEDTLIFSSCTLKITYLSTPLIKKNCNKISYNKFIIEMSNTLTAYKSKIHLFMIHKFSQENVTLKAVKKKSLIFSLRSSMTTKFSLPNFRLDGGVNRGDGNDVIVHSMFAIF